MKDRIEEMVLRTSWLEITTFRYWNFRMKSVLLENMAECTGNI